MAASGSTPRPCSASRKTAYQAEIDAACELIDFWRFNVHFAKQILTEQPIANSPRHLEPHRPPPARGLRLRDHAVQLHRDRRQPADRSGADGQHGASGSPSPTQQLAASLTDGAAGGGRPAARRHQHAARRRPRRLRGRAGPPRPRRHPLHRLDADLPAPVARGRRATSPATAPTRGSSARPAARTSSSPTRRPTPTCCASALIRGAFEYQGQKCSAASRAYVAAVGVDEDARPASSPRSRRSTMGDVTDFSNFMGAVIDDRAFAKHKAAIDRAKRSQAPRPSSPAARPTTRSATSSARPSCESDRPDRRDVHDRVLRPDPDRPRLRRRATSRRSWRRWSRSRRTR